MRKCPTFLRHTYFQEAFFALSDGQNRQILTSADRAVQKRSLSCRTYPLPRRGGSIYTGQGVGVDCLFWSKALASRDHDKLNIVPRFFRALMFGRRGRKADNNITMERIHIGQLIKKVFKQEYSQQTISWFAGELHCNRTNVYDIFRRQSIDTDKLRQISIILSHDFFADISQTINGSLTCPPIDISQKKILYNNIMADISKLLNDHIHNTPSNKDNK